MATAELEIFVSDGAQDSGNHVEAQFCGLSAEGSH